MGTWRKKKEGGEKEEKKWDDDCYVLVNVRRATRYAEEIANLECAPFVCCAHKLLLLCMCLCLSVRAPFFFLSLCFYNFSFSYFQVDSLRRTLSSCSNKREREWEREKGKNRCVQWIENTPSLCNLHLNKNESEGEREREKIERPVKLISSFLSYANSGALRCLSLARFFFLLRSLITIQLTLHWYLWIIPFIIHETLTCAGGGEEQEEEKRNTLGNKSDWCKIRSRKRTNKKRLLEFYNCNSLPRSIEEQHNKIRFVLF